MPKKQYKKGLVSIVITTYKVENLLPETLDSVLAQTYTDLEIIVADDASPDNTAEVIKKYAAKDKRIVPILHEKNIGFSRNMNSAFERCTGEFVAKVDGDDLWLPEKVEKQVKFLNENPEYVLTHCNMEVFHTDTGEKLFNLNEKGPMLLRPLPYAYFTDWFFRKTHQMFVYSSLLARSEYMLSHLWDTRIPLHNELLHLVSVYMENPKGKWHVFNEVLGRYRYRPDSSSNAPVHNTFLFEEVFVKTAVTQAIYPELSKTAKNHKDYFMFRQLLFNWIPKEKKAAYLRQFWLEAGCFKFCYLLLCKFLLKIKLLFPVFKPFRMYWNKTSYRKG